MRKDILKISQNKLLKLSKKYDGFINIIVDDWRGFRFIFDTKDVRKCKNDCLNCPLYQLLKNEKEGVFSSTLYPANKNDKKLFGPQNFLNCKTLSQYQSCYLNYLKKYRSKKEIKDELKLIKEMKVIYSTEENINKLENKFKKPFLKI